MTKTEISSSPFIVFGYAREIILNSHNNRFYLLKGVSNFKAFLSNDTFRRTYGFTQLIVAYFGAIW